MVNLAYQLKNKMGCDISLNRHGVFDKTLIGRYLASDEELYFFIEYDSAKYLKVLIAGAKAEISKKKTATIMDFLETLQDVKDDEGNAFGNPLAFYNVINNDNKYPCLEWSFCDCEDRVSDLISENKNTSKIQDLILIGENIKTKKRSFVKSR